MSFDQRAEAAAPPRTIFAIFSDRKINTRIGIGLACILAITAGISVIAYTALAHIGTSFAQYSKLGDVVANAQDVDRGFLAFRRYAVEFALTGQEEVAVSAQKARAALKDLLAKGLSINDNPEQRAKLARAAEQIEHYGKDFDKVGTLRRDQDRLQRDVLDPNGARLRTEIEQLQAWAAGKAGNGAAMLAGDALKQLMLARLHVNKNLVRHDQASATSAGKAFADLKAAMAAFAGAATADEARRMLDDINARVAAYEVAYKKAAHDSHEIETLVHGEMRNLALSIAEQTAAIRQRSVAAEEEIQHQASSLILKIESLVVMLAVGGIALGVLLAWLIGRSVSQPIQRMTQAMGVLANGDLTVEVPGRGRRDEIGGMAAAVAVFKQNAIERARLEAETEAQRQAAERDRAAREAEKAKEAAEAQATIDTLAASLGRLARGDLLCRIDTAFVPTFEQLRSDFNAAVDKLKDTIRGVVTCTQSMHSGTQEISTASNDLSRRTEQQASSLEETAAALDEITATVKKAAEGATHARQVVADTKVDAEKSGEVVRKAVAAMGSIEKSSQQIGQIIGVIDEIAFQTNLLALNAGVEAARAGDAGRGFAVVASEVRALAQRSAEAAKEIKSLISTSTAQVGEGVQLVAETGQSLERIMAKVAEINTVVTDIASGAQEQATGLQQVNTAVNEMDKVTQQNAAMAEQATAAGRSLTQEAEQLSSLVGQFRVGTVAEFQPVRRPAAQAASRSEPIRSPNLGKSDAQAARRQLKVPAGRNGSAAHKTEAQPAEDGWQDF